MKRALARLHAEARPFLGRALLIGGAACLFYRARLYSVGDPDFQIPAAAPEAESLWLSKDLDFTGVFSGDAMNLIPQFTARDAMGREFLEVEGVRLGNEPVTLFHTRIGKRHGRAAARPYPPLQFRCVRTRAT